MSNKLLKIIKIIVLFIFVIKFIESLFVNGISNQYESEEDFLGENLTNYARNERSVEREGFTHLKVGVLMASSLGKEPFFLLYFWLFVDWAAEFIIWVAIN
jgi:hypothetical protein